MEVISAYSSSKFCVLLRHAASCVQSLGWKDRGYKCCNKGRACACQMSVPELVGDSILDYLWCIKE